MSYRKARRSRDQMSSKEIKKQNEIKLRKQDYKTFAYATTSCCLSYFYERKSICEERTYKYTSTMLYFYSNKLICF